MRDMFFFFLNQLKGLKMNEVEDDKIYKLLND